ncbi:MAG: glycosyltransferase family 4 protein [Acidimicrobiales bacterium]
MGGFAVVYRYANEMSRRGHNVTIVHPRFFASPPLDMAWAKSWLWRYKVLAKSDRGRPLWFDLDDAVDTVLIRQFTSRVVPQADAIFATACNTAEPVSRAPSDRGSKFYLIQGFEDWGRSVEDVNSTWRLPMHKVVISRWLEEIGVALGESARLTYIPNGVDTTEFTLNTAPEDRAPNSIGLLAHRDEGKGTADGVAAITLARQRYPTTSLTLFGVDPRPKWLPTWANYVENPSHSRLVELYNSWAIFLHASWAEGFALPPAEAMLSGCALVASANKGVQEYAVEGQTALLAPVRDPEALSERICLLLSNQALRCRLARNGHDAITRFSWQAAADAMEQMLIAKAR